MRGWHQKNKDRINEHKKEYQQNDKEEKNECR